MLHKNLIRLVRMWGGQRVPDNEVFGVMPGELQVWRVGSAIMAWYVRVDTGRAYDPMRGYYHEGRLFFKSALVGPNGMLNLLRETVSDLATFIVNETSVILNYCPWNIRRRGAGQVLRLTAFGGRLPRLTTRQYAFPPDEEKLVRQMIKDKSPVVLDWLDDKGLFNGLNG